MVGLFFNLPQSPQDMDIKTIQRYGKLIAYEFANDDHPGCHIAYWRYSMYRHEGKIWIIENRPKGNDLESILKEVTFRNP